MNKNVLIISYHFPPRATASAIRPGSVAKHVSDFGWTPIVVTAKNPDRYSSAIDQSAKIPSDLRIEPVFGVNISPTLVYYLVRIIGIFARIFSKKPLPDNLANEIIFPDYNIGWIPFCFFKSLRIIKKNDIDIVYISCKPFSTAIVGYLLKKFLKDVKVVIEFQDPWTVNPYHRFSNTYLKLAKATEKAIFKTVDMLLVVTKGHKDAYLKEYEWLNVEAVYIGYDNEEFNKLFKCKHGKDKFIVLHAGTFYLNRDPEKLLRAIVELDIDNIEFWNMGRFVEKFKDSFSAYSDSNNIHIFGFLPHKEVLKLLGNASLLYLNQARPQVEGSSCISVSAKTFEYLATGIPILADMQDGDNAEFIRAHSDNHFILSDPSVEDLKNAILEAYDLWLAGKWEHNSAETFSQEYNHRYLVEKISRIFDRLTD